jgi:hypothetical protein
MATCCTRRQLEVRFWIGSDLTRGSMQGNLGGYRHSRNHNSPVRFQAGMADERAVNELTVARSLGPYLRSPLELKLAFGSTSPSKAVTGIRELCAIA